MDKTRVEEAVVALVAAVGNPSVRVAVRTYKSGKTRHYRVHAGEFIHRFERQEP